jgi:hypothetical protein
MGALLHDDARAQKADARHDIGNHAHPAIGPRRAQPKVDKGRRAHRHQHIGAQPRRALAPLPLQPDQRAQQEGRQQADATGQQREHIDIEKFGQSLSAGGDMHGLARLR